MTERGGCVPGASRPVRGVALVLVASGLLVAGGLLAPRAEALPKTVRITLTGPAGERTIEADDLRFVFFHTRYRTTRAPVEESPTRERTEILSDRDDCKCLRLADYSRIRFNILRSIEVRTTPGDKVASVQVVRKDGKTHEYPATALYGGDGLAPPLIMATIDGVAREFPLILQEEGNWPDEMLVRALLTRPPPPKKGSTSR